jgi:hypothetical protein
MSVYGFPQRFAMLRGEILVSGSVISATPFVFRKRGPPLRQRSISLGLGEINHVESRSHGRRPSVRFEGSCDESRTFRAGL